MKKKWYEKRLNEAMDLISQALGIIEELKDEQEEKLDNVPENLQNSYNYEVMEARLEAFEELYNNLEETSYIEVE